MNCGKRVSNKKIVPTSIGQGFLTSKAVSAIEPEASLDGGEKCSDGKFGAMLCTYSF